MDFQLPIGIYIENTDGLCNAYERKSGELSAVLSAELLEDFLYSYLKLIDEPIFFFLELPCSDAEEKELGETDGYHYKLYYLDNCTREVAGAILKCYGSMLVNDGLCRFGFGSNDSDDEVYIQSYKVIGVFSESESVLDKTAAVLERLGAVKKESIVTPWDLLSKDNVGECVCIDEEGFTVYDIPKLLEEVGMYFDKIVSDSL